MLRQQRGRGELRLCPYSFCLPGTPITLHTCYRPKPGVRLEVTLFQSLLVNDVHAYGHHLLTVNLGKSLTFSGPRFPRLYNGDNTTSLEHHCEDYRR